ncbi:MAG: hypothetical protein ACTH61_09475, partial [Lactococcus cremoris]
IPEIIKAFELLCLKIWFLDYKSANIIFTNQYFYFQIYILRLQNPRNRKNFSKMRLFVWKKVFFCEFILKKRPFGLIFLFLLV